MARRTRSAGLVALLAAGLLIAGCSGASDSTSGTPDGDGTTAATQGPAPAGPELSGDLVVFAAASLTDTFTAFAELLEAEHPDLTVTINPGASSALAQQLLAGAPADVVAMASTSTMDQVTDLVEAPEVFATNTLEIAVPAGNPGDVHGLVDLADPDRTIALCAVEVPCGAAAAKLFEVAGLVPAPDTYEKDVTATLTKAVLGEVDAALVYRTDVISAGTDVEGIEVPEASQVPNDYPIAVLTDAPNPEAAAAFRDLVLSPVGQDALATAGFDVGR